MTAKKGIFAKYRFVFQSSPLATKFALLITILVAVVCLSVLGGYIANLNAQTEELRHYAADLEQQIDQLNDKVNQLGTVESVTDIAGDELGMVDKDSTIVPVQ